MGGGADPKGKEEPDVGTLADGSTRRIDRVAFADSCPGRGLTRVGYARGLDEPNR